MVELTPDQQRLLSQAPLGHLATANASAEPHVVPICYAFNGRFIYSVLDRKPKRASLGRLRRVRNIRENPRVSLVVDHYEDDWDRLWYLLVMGAAEVLLEGQEQEDAVRLLRQKYPQYREMDIDQNPVIKITPERVVSWGADG